METMDSKMLKFHYDYLEYYMTLLEQTTPTTSNEPCNYNMFELSPLDELSVLMV